MWNTVTEAMCVGVDDCSSLGGMLIIAGDHSDGEKTLKRGDDTYLKCRSYTCIDSLSNFRGLRQIKTTAIVAK
jgi:hypothetical protein